ncbi:tetratricopeptide repeat-containing sensor histidine kinase [Aquimarina rhabdastrellae]
MKKLYLLLLLIISIFNHNYAQSSLQKIDSLKNILNNHNTTDSNYIDTLNDISWEYLSFNNSESLKYAIKANNLSKETHYDPGLSTSFFRMGSAYIKKEDYTKATLYLFKSLNLEKKNTNLNGVAKVKIQLGKLFRIQKQYDKALQFYNEALLIKQQFNNKKDIANIFKKIAILYKTQNEYSQAIKYFTKELQIRDSLNLEKEKINCYKNLGYCYNELKKYQNALFELKKGKKLAIKLKDSLQLSDIYVNIGNSFFNLKSKSSSDSAYINYNKALQIKNKLQLQNNHKIYNNLGLVSKLKKDYDSAISFFLRSVDISIKLKDYNNLTKAYYNLGNLYLELQLYEKALYNHHKALVLSKEYNILSLRLRILMSLAEDYEQLGNFKQSSFYNEQHIVLRDSIDSKTLKKIDNESLQLKENIFIQQKQLSIAENSKQQLQLYGAIAIALILLILFFVSRRNYRLKKQTLIAQHTAAKKEAEFDELLKNQELKSIHAMIDGQEKERKRIAQDLHDRLGSMLSMVKIHYKSVEDNLDKIKAEAREQYDRANTLLDEACVAVREISHNMVSGVLTKFGLIAALNELKTGIESTNALQVELIDHGFDDRIDNQLEINIYRIIQELISNILKHAQAQEVSIQLFKRDDNLQIMVEDDGVGFDTKLLSSFSGMGLKGIQSRVQNLNGTIDFDSRKHHGTTVTITIPLQQNTTAI